MTYTPDAAGRMVSAVDVANGANYATLALYAPHGALASVKHGVAVGFAGITETRSYNKRLQPSILSASTTTNTVLSFSYDFNLAVANNGNVKQIVNNVNSARTQSFTYDELNRVKTAQTQATTGSLCWGQTFSYDIWANLHTIGAVSGYGACTQQLLSIGAGGIGANNRINGWSYDNAGNLLTYPGYGSYAYDAESRMTSTGGVTYTYDAEGQRVMKSNGTLYWHGLGGETLMETDLSGNTRTEFIFFNGQRIARRDPNGTAFYFFSDHLGSSRIVTNATGGTVEDSDFFPFGAERVVVDTLNNNYKFTGQERDSESGLDYFLARHYAFTLGRFLQPDEFTGGPVDAFSANDPLPPGPLPYADITNPQSLNKYTYTYNNPLRFTDPSGHCATTLTLPICAGAAIGGPAGAAVGVVIGVAATVGAAYALHHYSDKAVESTADRIADSAKDVAGKLGSALEGGRIAGEGAKSPEQAQKHADALREAADRMGKLKDEFKDAKGKAKQEIKDKIDKLGKEIKDHIKEIKQKWGDALKPDKNGPKGDSGAGKRA